MNMALSVKTGTQKSVVAQNNVLGVASLNPSSAEMKLFLPASKTKGNVVITDTQVAIQTAYAPEYPTSKLAGVSGPKRANPSTAKEPQKMKTKALLKRDTA
jgi:hypothetical protein